MPEVIVTTSRKTIDPRTKQNCVFLKDLLTETRSSLVKFLLLFLVYHYSRYQSDKINENEQKLGDFTIFYKN